MDFMEEIFLNLPKIQNHVVQNKNDVIVDSFPFVNVTFDSP